MGVLYYVGDDFFLLFSGEIVGENGVHHVLFLCRPRLSAIRDGRYGEVHGIAEVVERIVGETHRLFERRFVVLELHDGEHAFRFGRNTVPFHIRVHVFGVFGRTLGFQNGHVLFRHFIVV